MIERLVNDYATTLTAAWASGASPAVGADVDVASVNDAFGDPVVRTGQFRARIDTELVILTGEGAAAGKWKIVARGAENTAADAHANGADLEAVPTAAAIDRMIERRAPAYFARAGDYITDFGRPDNSGASGVANERACYFPVPILTEVTVDALSVNVVTAATGSQARLGLYENDPDEWDVPETLLEEVTVATTSTGIKEGVFAAPRTLLPGYYSLGYVPQGNATPASIGRWWPVLQPPLVSKGADSNVGGMWFENGITGALPNPPAFARTDAQRSSSYEHPRVWMRVS